MTLAGVDIGGTGVRIVLAGEDGRILARTAFPTLAVRGPEHTLGRIVDAIRSLSAQVGTQPGAVGIGVTGPVDVRTGVVDNPFTLGGWPPTDLRSPVAAGLHLPVAVDNDANVAALGEAWVGAARGRRRIAMVTIGTGIGVAVVLDGVVQRAVDGRHGEAGHMVVDARGPRCYCGARGCLEVLVAGPAIAGQARRRAQRSGGLILDLAGGRPAAIDSRMVFEAADRGDPTATDLIERIAGHLGLGLVNLCTTVMPDVFVIAGGIARHLPAMRSHIDAVLARHRRLVPTDVPVVAAELGDDAGAIGAARLAAALRDPGAG
jgi:glucokinase